MPVTLPRILRTPIDPTRNAAEQIQKRFAAAYHFFGEPCPRPEEIPPVVRALVPYSFPKCFEAKAKKLDPRCKVKRVGDLRRLVIALYFNIEKNLSDPELKKLSDAVRRDLEYRSKSRSVVHICQSISKLASNEWKGVKWTTLKDNLHRHPTEAFNFKAQKTLIASLKSVIAEIDAIPEEYFHDPD